MERRERMKFSKVYAMIALLLFIFVQNLSALSVTVTDVECVYEYVLYEGDTVSGNFVVVDHDIFWSSDHPGIDFIYDFPKQEAVIQFVIEAIQAEAFNPRTLFLIGSYTIGKERLFLEVARVLRKKVYVTLAKLRILECLGLPKEDMQWLTPNEHESYIHVVPMWTLASFKRLKHISTQYQSRFSLVVAISPTGWTFGKGKKKSPGRRWQQGTIIRYEVPYSEHSSFTELREFVKLVSPVNIIPSVNNEGPESTAKMLSLLSSPC